MDEMFSMWIGCEKWDFIMKVLGDREGECRITDVEFRMTNCELSKCKLGITNS